MLFEELVHLFMENRSWMVDLFGNMINSIVIFRKMSRGWDLLWYSQIDCVWMWWKIWFLDVLLGVISYLLKVTIASSHVLLFKFVAVNNPHTFSFSNRMYLRISLHFLSLWPEQLYFTSGLGVFLEYYWFII